jgi:hypothetical protein
MNPRVRIPLLHVPQVTQRVAILTTTYYLIFRHRLSNGGACEVCKESWSRLSEQNFPHVRFRQVQTLVREGSPLVKLRNSA